MKKNNINLDQYYKSKAISDELVKLLSDEKSANLDTIAQYLENNRYSDELKTTLTNQSQLEESIARFNQFDGSAEAKNLTNQLEKLSRRKRLRRILTTGSIAAAVIFLSFAVYNMTPTNQPKEQLAQEVMTIKKPTIILPTGKIITLEEANKQIVSDGYTLNQTNNTLSALMTGEKNEEHKNLMNKLVMPSMHTMNVQLADGSMVTLNAGSELTYPLEFNNDSREVTLKGEAYFEIVKSDKPFIVNINDVHVRVYGTRFNVKSTYDESIETVLIDGSVGVRKDGLEEIRITPNQRAIIEKNGEHVVQYIDVQSYMGWLGNYFRYHNSNLRQILKDVEMWYGVQIDATTMDNDILIDVFISRDSSLEKVFRLIEATTEYIIINNGGEKYKIIEKK